MMRWLQRNSASHHYVRTAGEFRGFEMRSILFVPRLANNRSNCRSGLAYAYSMIACLSGSADLTILTPREINPTETKDFLKKYFEAPVNVVSLSEIDTYSNRPLESRLEDHKPFVNESSRVLELINKVNYDCVVFDVFGAAGFIPVRSKRTGKIGRASCRERV